MSRVSIPEPPQPNPQQSPSEVAEDDDASSTLQLVVTALFFLGCAVACAVKWDSIALPRESFAGGRTASMRKLLGRLGQVPTTLILAALGLLAVWGAMSQFRSDRAKTNTA